MRAAKERVDTLKYFRMVHDALKLPRGVDEYGVIQFMVSSKNVPVAAARRRPTRTPRVPRTWVAIGSRSVASLPAFALLELQ